MENVEILKRLYKDYTRKFVSKIIKQGNEIVTKTNQLEKEVLEITNSKI